VLLTQRARPAVGLGGNAGGRQASNRVRRGFRMPVACGTALSRRVGWNGSGLEGCPGPGGMRARIRRRSATGYWRRKGPKGKQEGGVARPLASSDNGRQFN
jgi:hypothetical protein